MKTRLNVWKYDILSSIKIVFDKILHTKFGYFKNFSHFSKSLMKVWGFQNVQRFIHFFSNWRRSQCINLNLVNLGWVKERQHVMFQHNWLNIANPINRSLSILNDIMHNSRNIRLTNSNNKGCNIRWCPCRNIQMRILAFCPPFPMIRPIILRGTMTSDRRWTSSILWKPPSVFILSNT